jgi:hypothetical protein
MGQRTRRQKAGAANVAKRLRVSPHSLPPACFSDDYRPSSDDGDSTCDDSISEDAIMDIVQNARDRVQKPRGPYSKNSRSTLARKKKHASKFSQPITNFFTPIPSHSAEGVEDITNSGSDADDEYDELYDTANVFQDEEEDSRNLERQREVDNANIGHLSSEESSDKSSEDEPLQYCDELQKRLQELADLLAKSKHAMKLTCWEYTQCIAIEEYLDLIHVKGINRLKASRVVANGIFHWKAGVNWKAKTVRRWANYWCRHGALPTSQRGKHQKTRSYIEDEDVQEKCLIWIRSQRGEITSRYSISCLHDFMLIT